MTREKYLSVVREIMMEFAALTGTVTCEKTPEALFVDRCFCCLQFFGALPQTDNEQYRDLATRLVNQVHSVLGRHREDDVRKGWISGLSEKEGEQHPTRGGLRIGKKLNERKPDDPI